VKFVRLKKEILLHLKFKVSQIQLDNLEYFKHVTVKQKEEFAH